MAEALPPAGLISAIRAKLNLLMYTRDFRGAFIALCRAGRLLATGRFGHFLNRLRTSRHGLKPAGSFAPVRTGPPLYLAGHIHGYGGYDHVVLKALIGLTASNVHVFRDPRAFMKPECVPDDAVPTERMYTFDEPRLAIIPPHLLYRFRPQARTAAWTMWETDTLPRGCTKYLNKCGLLMIPSQWGVDCFRANGTTAPMEVVPLGYDPGEFSPRPADSGPEICTFGTAVRSTRAGCARTCSASSTCS